jgi:outer membrane receptor protein involved in Fe transport
MIPLLAATLHAGSSKQETFSVPAGNADVALKRFATQSGFAMIVSSKVTKGIKTRAVYGPKLPEEALEELLAGTGLEAQIDWDARAFTVRRSEAGGKAMAGRPTGRVQAPPPERLARLDLQQEVLSLSPYGVSASSTVGYGALATGSSGRLKQTYAETPQFISVVTSEMMEDAALHDSAVAVMFVPNVQATRTSDLQVFSIRGVGTQHLYADGFLAYSLQFVDMAFTDRIEVVRGPSPTAFGRGDPAGFINFISKRPLFAPRSTLSSMIGTGGPRDNLRVVLDHNDVLGEHQSVSYRFVGQYARGSNTREGSEFSRLGGMLAVDYRLSNGGEIQVTAHRFRNQTGGAVANLSFSDATLQHAFRSTLAPGPPVPLFSPDHAFRYDGTGFTSDLDRFAVVLHQGLGDRWNTRQAFHYARSSLYGQGTAGNASSVRESPAGLLVTLPANLNDKERRGWSYQADFLYETMAPGGHGKIQLMFGADVSKDALFNSVQAAPGVGTQLLQAFNPAVPITFPVPTRKLGVRTRGLTGSPYVQARFTALQDRLQATLAARRIFADEHELNVEQGTRRETRFGSPLLPMASVLFRPGRGVSVYAMFSRYQERPTSMTQFNGIGGVVLPAGDPRSLSRITVQPTTELREIGIKGTVWENKLAYSLTAFAVRNTGVARLAIQPDAQLGSVGFNFTSDDRVTGWEMEVFGQPTPRLTFMMGAGFMGSRANVPVAGGEIYNLAYPGNPDNVHGYVRYSFGPTPRRGLSALLGVKSFLSEWSANVNSVGSLGNLPYPRTVTICNLGLDYHFANERDSISLKVTNAFHREAVVAGSFTAAVSGRQLFLGFDRQF